jgi:hypothetical protein
MKVANLLVYNAHLEMENISSLQICPSRSDRSMIT